MGIRWSNCTISDNPTIGFALGVKDEISNFVSLVDDLLGIGKSIDRRMSEYLPKNIIKDFFIYV